MLNRAQCPNDHLREGRRLRGVRAAKLVRRAEDWRFASLYRWTQGAAKAIDEIGKLVGKWFGITFRYEQRLVDEAAKLSPSPPGRGESYL